MVAPWMEQLLLCGAHYSQRPGGSPHHQASLGAQWWSWLWWSWIILNNIIFAIIIIVHFVWSSGWAKTIIADNLLTKSCKTSPIKVLSDVVDNYNVWTGWKGPERWNKWNYRHFVGEMMTSRAFSPSPPWPSGHSLTPVKIITIFNLIHTFDYIFLSPLWPSGHSLTLSNTDTNNNTFSHLPDQVDTV